MQSLEKEYCTTFGFSRAGGQGSDKTGREYFSRLINSFSQPNHVPNYYFVKTQFICTLERYVGRRLTAAPAAESRPTAVSAAADGCGIAPSPPAPLPPPPPTVVWAVGPMGEQPRPAAAEGAALAAAAALEMDGGHL